MGSTGYDYGNARLRAMKSRLLTRLELEELVDSSSMEGLITALANTTYRQAIQAALVRASGIACIAEALKQDLEEKYRRVDYSRAQEFQKKYAISLLCETSSKTGYNNDLVFKELAKHIIKNNFPDSQFQIMF